MFLMKYRVKSVLRLLSTQQDFVLIRTIDIAVLICTTPLLWGILHCIILAKQNKFMCGFMGWTVGTSAMRRSKG